MSIEEKVQNLIQEILAEIGDERGNEQLINSGPNTSLYGADGHLDSLSLVRLTADLEEEISEGFNKEIFIADERALSQRFSPFRTVATLSDYILKLLKEADE